VSSPDESGGTIDSSEHAPRNVRKILHVCDSSASARYSKMCNIINLYIVAHSPIKGKKKGKKEKKEKKKEKKEEKGKRKRKTTSHT